MGICIYAHHGKMESKAVVKEYKKVGADGQPDLRPNNQDLLQSLLVSSYESCQTRKKCEVNLLLVDHLERLSHWAMQQFGCSTTGSITRFPPCLRS